MQDTRQLLCTFSNVLDYKNLAKQICKFYTVYNNKIFVFIKSDNLTYINDTNNVKELYLTYNILNTEKEFPKFPNTISIHRKKQTNTLYTLNSLNVLIKEETGGTLDKTFQLNWEYYRDSLIITGEISIRIIPIKIHDILT